MTGKQRALKALRHEEPDRIPLSELTIEYKVASSILGRDAITGIGGYVSAKKCIEAVKSGRFQEYRRRFVDDTIELYARLDLDIVSLYSEMRGDLPEEAGENAWIYRDAQTDSWTKVQYQPESDEMCPREASFMDGSLPPFEEYLEKHIAASENREPNPDLLDSLAYALKKAGDEKLIAGMAGVDIYLGCCWFPLYAETMCVNPGLVKRFMEAQTKAEVRNIHAQADLGIELIWAGGDLACNQGPLISPTQFREFLLPYLRRITGACHERGMFYIYHTDGNIKPIERDFLVESGIDGFHPIEPRAGMDVAELKRKYGKTLTLCGNIDCTTTLVREARDEIVNEVKECLRKGARGGGHILTSSNSIHNQIPAENYLIMIEAAKTYGRYPINL